MTVQNKVEKILNNKNIRPTAMRILVYKLLLTSETAISLTDLENHFESADRTTLYRTIKTFENQGVVHAIDDGTGVTKYALCHAFCNSEEHNDLHLHFHCHVCEETTCLTEYSIPKIKLPENYIAQDVNLIVRGICKNCHQRE